MAGTLRVEVLENDQSVYMHSFTGVVELGRQMDANEELYSQRQLLPGYWRAVIGRLDEVACSRKHLKLEPVGENLVRVTNLSTEARVRTSDGAELPALSTRDFPLPLALLVGQMTVRVEGSEGGHKTFLRSLAPGSERHKLDSVRMPRASPVDDEYYPENRGFGANPLTPDRVAEMLRRPPPLVPPDGGDDPNSGSGDNIDCAVFAPAEVCRGEDVLIQVFAYSIGDEAVASELAREFDASAVRRGLTTLAAFIRRGQVLQFHLMMHGIAVQDATRQVPWLGRTSSVQFGVSVPANRADGNLLGSVLVGTAGVPVGRIDFKLVVTAKKPETSKEAAVAVGHAAARFRKAFVSYAREDRPEVMRRVQMLRPQLTDIEVFQDVLTLKPGEPYDLLMSRRINECDIFLLFWSSNARRSQDVQREIRCARERQGANGEPPPMILPVIIEGPPPPPPPPELAHLHFDDYLLYFIDSDRRAGDKKPAPATNDRLRELQVRRSALADDLRELGELMRISVPSALNKVRYITEKELHRLCRRDGVSWGQGEPTLERMIGPLVATGSVPKDVATHIRTIQTNASPGSHYQESALSRSHLDIAMQAMVELLDWAGQ
jgi:hypothetical protein